MKALIAIPALLALLPALPALAKGSEEARIIISEQ
jgi:hypothetical protein